MLSKVLALRGHVIKYSGVRRHEVLAWASTTEHACSAEEPALWSRLWATTHALPLPEMLVLAVSNETPPTQVKGYGDEI